MTAVWVALGAGVGAVARYLTMQAIRSRFGTTPVVGTLTVNVVGSFVLGLLAHAVTHGSTAYLLVGVGFCGAFTTFSTLGLELWEALEEREFRSAAINAALTLSFGIGAAWFGWLLGTRG